MLVKGPIESLSPLRTPTTPADRDHVLLSTDGVQDLEAVGDQIFQRELPRHGPALCPPSSRSKTWWPQMWAQTVSRIQHVTLTHWSRKSHARQRLE